jgi:hypothetical protein
MQALTPPRVAGTFLGLMEHHMTDAEALIARALDQSEEIKAAGRMSLVGIATRAVKPDARLSKRGIAEALGLPPPLVVSMMVAADHAGDTASRRELGQYLFQRIQLHARTPELTASGRLKVAVWCLERLKPTAESVAELLARTVELAQAASQGQTPAADALSELQKQAIATQKVRLKGVKKTGERDRLGISATDRVRRHAAQAVWAVVEGLRGACESEDFCTTVAGETTAAVAVGEGTQESAELCVALARFIDDLPAEHLIRPPSNGG